MSTISSRTLALLAAIASPTLAAAQEPAPEAQPVWEALPAPEAQPAPEALPDPKAQPDLTARPAPPSGRVEPSARAAGKKATTGELVLGFVLFEGVVGGLSWWASDVPKGFGWILVVAAPLTYAIHDYPPAEIWEARVATAGMTGLGLYNALVLSKDSYSASQRFWQNVAAWHAIAVSSLAAKWLTAPDDSSAPRVSFLVGPRADRLVVLVSGRF
jgi:hypothetical protein